MPRFSLALAAFLSFCAGTARAGWVAAEKPGLGSVPGGAQVREWTLRKGDQSAILTAVVFSERDYRVAVLDNPSQTGRLAGAVLQAGAAAGINGGYFHKDGTPLGLAVSGGKTVHAFEKAKLLSGVLAQRGKKLQLVRSGAFSPGADVAAALQAGPWLVESRQPVSGLNAARLARRTVVATDGQGNWALVSLSPLTLAGTAEVLCAAPLFEKAPVKDALNLDGGSSTALWAGTEPNPLSISEFGSVRNYVVILPRKP